MPKLNISQNQKQVLDSVDSNMQSVFSEGAETNGLSSLPLMDKYSELASEVQNSVKLVFKQLVASVLKSLNIDKPLPEVKFSGTVSIPSTIPNQGNDGSITVDEGIVTSLTAPVPPSAFTGTITLARLTPVVGTQGSIQVVNGIITAYTAPT